MSSRKIERIIVCDASPLILLAKIARLDLLPALANEVWIPAAVWDEVVVQGDERPEVDLIRRALHHCIVNADPAMEAAFRLQVDAGEAAALALVARNPDACLLCDDQRGRRIAQIQGWRYIGTLGWLVRAKKAGLIASLQPILSQMLAGGWYIAPNLINRALHAAGET